MPELFGHMLENFVATELQKTLSYGKTQGTLFHFRTSDGKKIDFVIEFSDGMRFAIEIKRSGSVGSHDFASLKLLAKETGRKFIGGGVLHNGKEALPFGNNLWAVPLQILWQ